MSAFDPPVVTPVWVLLDVEHALFGEVTTLHGVAATQERAKALADLQKVEYGHKYPDANIEVQQDWSPGPHPFHDPQDLVRVLRAHSLGVPLEITQVIAQRDVLPSDEGAILVPVKERA